MTQSPFTGSERPTPQPTCLEFSPGACHGKLHGSKVILTFGSTILHEDSTLGSAPALVISLTTSCAKELRDVLRKIIVE